MVKVFGGNRTAYSSHGDILDMYRAIRNVSFQEPGLYAAYPAIFRRDVVARLDALNKTRDKNNLEGRWRGWLPGPANIITRFLLKQPVATEGNKKYDQLYACLFVACKKSPKDLLTLTRCVFLGESEIMVTSDVPPMHHHNIATQGSSDDSQGSQEVIDLTGDDEEQSPEQLSYDPAQEAVKAVMGVNNLIQAQDPVLDQVEVVARPLKRKHNFTIADLLS